MAKGEGSDAPPCFFRLYMAAVLVSGGRGNSWETAVITSQVGVRNPQTLQVKTLSRLQRGPPRGWGLRAGSVAKGCTPLGVPAAHLAALQEALLELHLNGLHQFFRGRSRTPPTSTTRTHHKPQGQNRKGLRNAGPPHRKLHVMPSPCL